MVIWQYKKKEVLKALSKNAASLMKDGWMPGKVTTAELGIFKDNSPGLKKMDLIIDFYNTDDDPIIRTARVFSDAMRSATKKDNTND